MKFGIRGFFFRTSVEKIQVSLNSDKDNGCVTRRPLCVYGNISRVSFLNKKMFEVKVVEKIKTHISCSVHFFII